MVHACTAKMAKFVVCGVNFVLGALGAALLALGIWAKVDKNIYTVLTFMPNIDWVSTIAIAVGAIIFLIGFCGCFGAFCEIRLLLFIYEALMFLLVVVELCALVGLIFLGAGAESFVMDGAKKVIKNTVGKYDGIEQTLTEFIYGIQFEFKCCGVESYKDYEDSHYLKSQDIQKCAAVPLTCCERNSTGEDWRNPPVLNKTTCCDVNSTSSTGRNNQGCLSSIIKKILDLLPFAALIAIPIIAVAAIALQV
jgi:hypothetical protein